MKDWHSLEFVEAVAARKTWAQHDTWGLACHQKPRCVVCNHDVAVLPVPDRRDAHCDMEKRLYGYKLVIGLVLRERSRPDYTALGTSCEARRTGLHPPKPWSRLHKPCSMVIHCRRELFQQWDSTLHWRGKLKVQLSHTSCLAAKSAFN